MAEWHLDECIASRHLHAYLTEHQFTLSRHRDCGWVGVPDEEWVPLLCLTGTIILTSDRGRNDGDKSKSLPALVRLHRGRAVILSGSVLNRGFEAAGNLLCHRAPAIVCAFEREPLIVHLAANDMYATRHAANDNSKYTLLGNGALRARR